MTDQPDYPGEPDAPKRSPSPPQIGPVDEAWRDLKSELSPTRALVHLDNTLALVGAVATGLGALALRLPGLSGRTLALTMTAAACAAASVIFALLAQLAIVPHGDRINPRILVEVRRWYYNKVGARASFTRLAIFSLLAAIILGGIVAFHIERQGPPTSPGLSVTQIVDPGGGSNKTTITVRAAFPSLSPADSLFVTISVGGQDAGWSLVTPGRDGTATTTLTVGQIPYDAKVVIDAETSRLDCKSTLSVNQAVNFVCHHR